MHLHVYTYTINHIYQRLYLRFMWKNVGKYYHIHEWYGLIHEWYGFTSIPHRISPFGAPGGFLQMDWKLFHHLPLLMACWIVLGDEKFEFFLMQTFFTPYSRCKSKDPLPQLTTNSRSWQRCIVKLVVFFIQLQWKPGVLNLCWIDMVWLVKK